MEFVDADVDPELPTVHAVADWLAEQRIGQVTAVTPQPLLVDIEAADLVVDLDIHPLVREAIDDSPLRDGAIRVHLDAGLIRLGGDIGRPITQAVFRALHVQHPEVDGIAYWSRIDPSERCWSIYGHVPVDVTIGDLSADDPAPPSSSPRRGGFAESSITARLAVMPRSARNPEEFSDARSLTGGQQTACRHRHGAPPHRHRGPLSDAAVDMNRPGSPQNCSGSVDSTTLLEHRAVDH